MKNSTSTRTNPNLRPLIALALAITAAFTVPSANAISINPTSYTLTLTELSAASLTVMYTGPSSTVFSVTPNSPDDWTVSYNSAPQQYSQFSLIPFFVWDWREPEDPNEFNEVSHGPLLGSSLNTLYVQSDESILEYAGDFSTMLENNTPTPIAIGTDGGVPVFLVFNDLAQQSENGTGVPDTGSTLLLLGLSVAGLTLLNRSCRPRLA